MAFAITALTGVFSKIKAIGASKWKKFGESMKGVASAAKETSGLEKFASLGSLLSPVVELLDPLNGLFEVFSAVLQEALIPVMDDLFDALLSPEVLSAVTAIAEAIAVLLVPFIQVLADVLTMLVESGAIDLIVLAIEQLASGFIDFILLIQPYIDDFMGLLGEFVTTIVQLVSSFSGDISDLGPLFADIIDAFINGIGLWFLQKIQEIEIIVGQAVIDFFTWIGEQIWSAIVDAGNVLGQVFAWLGAGIANAFIAMGNLIVDIINAIDFADVFEDIPSIQYLPMPAITFLAGGGIVKKTTSAVVGEAGPEAVIPLDKLENMINMGGGGSEEKIVVNFNGIVGEPQVRQVMFEIQKLQATSFIRRRW